MGFFTPVYAITIPFLLLLMVPLAIFASITTTLAFTVLLLRVLLVYLDIALSFVPKSFAGLYPRYTRYGPTSSSRFAPPSAAAAASRSPSPTVTSQLRRRRRRPSSASAISLDSMTAGGGDLKDITLGLIPSVGAERDFEGLGGWRTGDDEVWTTFNSRLEMPDRHHSRHHYRSASGGATTPGDGGYLMMKGRNRSPGTRSARPATSPNSSRARTPPVSRHAFASPAFNDGYFPLALSPKAAKKSTAHSVG